MSAYGQFDYQTTDGAGRALLAWPAPIRAPQPWRQYNFTCGTERLEIIRASASMAISSASELDESRMTSPRARHDGISRLTGRRAAVSETGAIDLSRQLSVRFSLRRFEYPEGDYMHCN
jgi:hypothetical protein